MEFNSATGDQVDDGWTDKVCDSNDLIFSFRFLCRIPCLDNVVIVSPTQAPSLSTENVEDLELFLPMIGVLIALNLMSLVVTMFRLQRETKKVRRLRAELLLTKSTLSSEDLSFSKM